MTEKECAYYMRQLLEGLQYMHKLNVVHLDLKVGEIPNCILSILDKVLLITRKACRFSYRRNCGR